MAIAVGSVIDDTDYNDAYTAINAFYYKVKGSYPTTIAQVAEGGLATAEAMNNLVSAYETALAGWHSTANSGYNKSYLTGGARNNNQGSRTT